MGAGRPSSYNKEIADKICEQISTTSLGLRHILKGDDMPASPTLYRWLENNEDFRRQYARAKELQAEYMADEIIEIVDDGINDFIKVTRKDGSSYNIEDKEWTSRSKMRYEARRWLMSKLHPKKYGDKLELDGNMNNNIGLAPEILAIANKINTNAK